MALAERLFGSWRVGRGRGPRSGPRDRRHRLDRRSRRPRHPPAGLGPDRDPDRSPRAAAPDRRLPRGLGHGRDPRRALQLAPEHEAARGEGLHVRRRCRLRHAPRRRAVLGPGRGQHRGHGPGDRRHARRADPDARHRGRRVRARRRTRLPDRRLPASVRDRRARSSGRWAAWPSTVSAVEELVGYRERIEAVGIDGDRRRRARRICTSTRPRSSSSATSTRSARRSRPPDLGRIVIERDEEPVASGPLDEVAVPGPGRRRDRDRTDGRRRGAVDPRHRRLRSSSRRRARSIGSTRTRAETFSRRVVSGE